MTCYHPCKNDKGMPVVLSDPHQPTPLITWKNPADLATATPGSPMPPAIGHLDIQTWSDVPVDDAGWEALAARAKFYEPPFKSAQGKNPASGAVILKPDGRVWVVSPSNGFGSYQNTFPKGKIDTPLLSLRANAMKEVLEESGLQVSLIGFLCDSERTTSTTRFYLARRTGGNPADMGWESQAVHLVPQSMLRLFVTDIRDQGLLEALRNFPFHTPTREDLLMSSTLASATRIVVTINAFRKRYGRWPERLLVNDDMATGIQQHVLTALAWSMLSSKLELIRIPEATVIAEGAGNARFEYDDSHPKDASGKRADVWIWGLELID